MRTQTFNLVVLPFIVTAGFYYSSQALAEFVQAPAAEPSLRAFKSERFTSVEWRGRQDRRWRAWNSSSWLLSPGAGKVHGWRTLRSMSLAWAIAERAEAVFARAFSMTKS